MKKFYKLIFILFIIIGTNLTAFPQLPGYVPTDSLKAWYPFNGNANDISGNNINGTLNGTTWAFVPGLFNQAVQFNNVNHSSWYDVNDYVSLPTFNLNNYSISFWMKFHSNAGWQNHTCYPFSLGDMSCNGSSGIGIESDGTLRSDFNPTTGFFSYKIIDTISSDIWYHVVNVIDGPKLSFFINGSLIDTVTIDINHNFNNHPIYLALHHWYCNGTSSSRFNGQIDNFGVWNRPLTSCEVYQLYTGIIQSNPTVNLGNDTTLAQGSTLTLNAGNPGSTYLWNTNDTTQNINVNTSGTYWVKVTNSGGCYSSDTIQVNFNNCAVNQLPLNLQQGLVAYYPFCGNANDISGNGNNGSVNGATLTTDRFGNPNSAYYFNGNGNNIEAPNHPSLNTVNLSISVWVKIENNAPTYTHMDIVSKDGECNERQYEIIKSDVEKFRVHAGINSSNFCHYDGVTTPMHDLWYHVVETYDGNMLKLYVNGQYEGNPICNGLSNLWQTTQPLRIGGGANITCPPYWFKGVIDDIYIFNRAITDCEVNQLYTGILANNPTVNLGNDTTLTQGSTLTLNAGNAGSTYLWSTNDTTQTINVSTSGTYWVKVTNSGGCYSSDTIHVNFTTSTTTNPMNDTTICKGETITLTANAAATNTWQYFQDFENIIGSEWSDTNRITYNNTKELGAFGNQTINLNLINLPTHDSVEVSFDLYIYDTWDGNYPGSMDFWKLYINNDTVLNTTFSNNFGRNQSFPQNYPANNPMQTGAFITNLPIRCSTFPGCNGSTLYKLKYTKANTNNSLNIGFGGGINQDACDEGWGIDSVKVKLLNVNSTPQYLWSTGATIASITVSPNQTTNYSVTLTNGSTTFADSATVYVLNPQINYGLPTNNLQKKIFYLKGTSSPYNIYSANISGTGETLIATGAIDASFGNNKIAFHNGSDVYIVNSDGTNLTIVPNTNDNPYQLDISKDETKICYAANDKLFTINTDGSNKTLFNNGSLTNEHQTRPSWKEAGKIYFVISNYGNAYTQKIYSKPDNNASATPTQLTTVFGQNPISGGIGNKVTYNGTTGVLYIMNSDGTNVSQLTNAGNIAWGGVWDADTIYYTSNGNIGRIRSNNTDNSIIINDGNIIKVIGVNIPDFVANTHDTTICKGESVILTAHGGSQQNICNKTQLPANLQQGLVAFYPFCGNANDESGSGHNGVVNGAILTTDRFGNANSAYNFNGLSNIVCPSTGLLNNKFTYSLWVNTASIPINNATSPISIGDNCADQALQLNTINPPCGWSFISYISCIPNPGVGGNSNSCPDLFKWYYLTITRDSTLHKIFIDGVLISSTNTNSTNPSYGNIPVLAIGSRADNVQKFNGKIDDVNIYNRALSANEIQQLYTLGTATSASYLWSTNDTTQSITVNPTQTTTYTLTATNGNISCMDTITVNVLNPQINNGQDTTICKGETMVLTAQTSSQNACNKSQLPTNLQQGLVAFYPFCGNANDESGNGNNGTVNGASLTTDRFGNANSAYSFDGSTNYITVPNSDSISSLINQATISGWIYSVNGQGCLVCKSFNAMPIDYRVYYGGGGLFSIVINGSTYDINTAVPNNQWTHIAVKYQNNMIQLFINGSYISQASSSGTMTIDKTSPLEIGRDPHGAFEYQNGKLDDIFIYNRALSISEISQIYNLGASTYLWSTNDTSQSITVTPNQTTTYTLMVTNGNISCMDTITVNVLNPQINNGQDTTICKGESVVLNAQTSSQNICNKSQLPANLQQGLVAFYPFCGNANDESGNGNNGTVLGATLTTDFYGNNNNAYFFNGSSQIDCGLSPQTNVSNMTLAAWIKVSTVIPTWQAIIGRYDINWNGSFELAINNDKINIWLTKPGAINYLSLNSNISIVPNVWYFIVATHDSTKTRIYINGIQDVENQDVFNVVQAPNDHLRIGSQGNFFPIMIQNGSIDNAMIFNRAFSPLEVNQLYNLGTPNNSASTYIWSTNDTTQSITVNPTQTTTYTLTATNGNINCMDTITVNVLNPQINNGQDTTICKGESIVLTANTSSQNICNKTQLPANLQQGLVAFYPFCGNANDESGSGHNGVVNGAILTTDRFGNANSAYLFNGVNNKITADTLPILNQYFSYSCWIKINGLTPVNIQSFGGLGGPQSLSHMWNFAYNPNLSIWNLYDYTNGSWFTNWTGQTSSSTLNWTNVTIVYNNVTEYLYVNGILLNQRTIVTPIQTFADRTLRLSEIGNQFFNGKIDDILIYNRALSISEISQIYNLGASTYLWSTNDTTQSITVTPNQTTTYTLMVTNGNISCMDTITVNVLNPQINLGNDTTICQGQSKTLAVGIGYSSYLWSTGAITSQITIQNSGTYWVKAISNLGCEVNDTINLTFLPVQSNILRDTILCLGQSVIFNLGAGFTNHLWSTGATTNSLIVSLPGTFWLQAKQTNGCMIRDTVVVKYDSLIVSIASFANPSCFGGNNGSINTTISSLYPPFTFSWNTTPVITTQNLSNLTAGNYTLTITDSLGCIKTASQTLTAPTPVVISLGNDTSFCQGQSIVLQATQVFASYLWSTGASTQSINVNTQGAYWLKGTNASGCSGYDTINITLNTTPVVQIAPTNPSICKGESITLTASSNIATTTYTWSNAALTSNVNLSPTITTSYFVIGKFNQCMDTAFATINVKPLPIISTTADKNPICEGESTNLTAGSNMPSTTYVWNNNVTGNTLSVAPTNSAYYYVTGTASNCHDTSGITINVINQQSINLGVDDYLCVGDEKTLNANNLLGTFLWSNGTSGNTMIVNEPGVFWLRVDNNGCISSDTIVLKPCSEIWVPNVFTPNNDGINDIFKAKTKEIQKLQLFIYNRWGNMVFETHDVNMGWDGKYAGGDAQSGVYYWSIKYFENRSSNQNVEKEIHGSVTLLR